MILDLGMRTSRPSSRSRGFTLIELMVTLVILGLVVAALATIMTNAGHSKDKTSQNLEATQTARATLDMLAKDVRTAGYGADLDYATPQPSIAYVDSTQIILSENQMPFPDAAVGHQGPVAYNPAASPNPQPLVSTQWTPPIKYHSGAELIRYTLDLNDDGVVDAGDIATAAGADARATRNPNDYVLVREVYGDSTGNTPGNNGGVQERVALVMKPGGGVPPLFSVYMKGSKTPYDWSSGPVPVAQLGNIDRVTMQVTAASAKPDNKGQYAQTTLRTQVNANRNVPNMSSTPQFAVTGYVYNDKNKDRIMNGVDVGTPGATVQLGTSFISYTNSAGFYSIQGPAGTYVLRHTPASGYGSFSSPDTFVVTLGGSAVSRSFADTAKAGGTATIHVYKDANGNATEDAGDSPLQGIVVSIASASGVTDASGNVALFAATGTWSATATLPDTLVATTSNPVSSSISAGGTATGSIGAKVSTNGDVLGTVYKDLNRNGVKDAGEAGVANVWVGVTKDGGVTVSGYALTNNLGVFDVSVPCNDPPKTVPYSVYMVPPTGYFPTGTTSVGGVWVKANNTASGYTFGLANYTVIHLSASRVLSLVASDLMEGDWPGNSTDKAHGDNDLVLGADAGGTDQISVWFNKADNSTNPFGSSGTTPDRVWAAPQSVLGMALDTLDKNVSPFNRPDLVTGTKYTPAGNFFVWYTQNSSGNEGYFLPNYSVGQNYLTSDNGDVQAVKTLDVIGGNKPDIIVGTKSSTANQGQIEIWTNSNANSPSFTRAETYTTYGAGSSIIGEVTALELVDLNNDGLKDMVVATKTGNYTGQVLYFQNMGKLALGNRFLFRQAVSLGGLAATALASSDLDGDGYQDIMVGTQNGTSSGSLIYLKNNGLWGFSTIKVVNAPGIVMSMAAADMGGGLSVKDLVVGYRGSTADYSGGVRIYYLDVGGIPDNGVDPSGGSIVNMVPAVATANFNYWTYPSGAPSPSYTDLAVGVKTSISAGDLWVFIR